MSYTGVIKSFNPKAGWGFITYDEQDIFLHINQCAKCVPKQGATVTFDTTDSPVKPEQKMATNVQAVAAGSYTAFVKSFVNKTGYGFIELEGDTVFLHIAECLDGTPKQGDQVTFDIEDMKDQPGRKNAKRVTGCSGPVPQEDGKGKGKDGKGGKGWDGWAPWADPWSMMMWKGWGKGDWGWGGGKDKGKGKGKDKGGWDSWGGGPYGGKDKGKGKGKGGW